MKALPVNNSHSESSPPMPRMHWTVRGTKTVAELTATCGIGHHDQSDSARSHFAVRIRRHANLTLTDRTRGPIPLLWMSGFWCGNSLGGSSRRAVVHSPNGCQIYCRGGKAQWRTGQWNITKPTLWIS
ncbi:MAG: hypothetical protein K0R68_856 [Mycobacterium sp.]|nr:hypothetical protein [Mycobacterium sp.]